MSELLAIVGTVVIVAAMVSVISTPFVVMHAARRIADRLEAVENQLASIEFDLDGPDDPDDGEPDIQPENIIAIGRRAA